MNHNHNHNHNYNQPLVTNDQPAFNVDLTYDNHNQPLATNDQPAFNVGLTDEPRSCATFARPISVRRLATTNESVEARGNSRPWLTRWILPGGHVTRTLWWMVTWWFLKLLGSQILDGLIIELIKIG